MQSRSRTLLGVVLTSAALTGCAALGNDIYPGQRGLKYIILDEPALRSESLAEGFYFQWPWNDMVTYDVTWKSRDERVEVLTSDDLHVPITATVTFRSRPDEIHKVHTTIGPSYYEDVIQPLFVTLVRSQLSNYAHNDLARNGRAAENAILRNLREKLANQPLDIYEVSIKHIVFDVDVTRSISRKLIKEQESQQKRFELEIAVQDAEIARTVASGRGDAIRIQAAGEAQATIIKGEAQAKAQDAIAKTLTGQYIQYKAFDSDSTTYYFVPVGKSGMPLIVNADPAR